MRRLNIACYYPWVYLRSGIERTILEVASRSKHRWTIYTNHFSVEGTYPDFSALDVVELPRVSVNRGYFHVLRAAIRIFMQKIPMKEHDILFVHCEGIGDIVTFRNHRKPVFCYCHTPLKVITDPWTRAQYIRRNRAKTPLLRLFGILFMSIDRVAWQHYTYVFANSKTVRNRIAKARLINKEVVEVLHPGADCITIRPTWHYEKYFLALTRIKWWKNVELAIEGFKAFRRICSVGSSFRLIVAGQVDEGSREYYRKLQKLAAPCGDICFIPNPSDKKVRSLYSSCYTVLNTTLNEDWGIVPIEANAYGKPVIAVDEGGTRESQVDGETGYLVSPEPKDFAHAMARLAQDERLVEAMGRNARQNALKYDWSFFVNRIDTVLEKLVGSNTDLKSRNPTGNLVGEPV